MTYTYSTPGRYSMATSAKKFTKTTVDGLGRTLKVETGYNPSVVESVVDTEYAPCACTPMGKLKRVSQPYKPGNPVVWTTYTYDELGRAVTVTHPPNTGSSGIFGDDQLCVLCEYGEDYRSGRPLEEVHDGWIRESDAGG